MNYNKPISKSQFTLSLQCKKAFYLYRFRPQLRQTTPAQEARFVQGRSFEPYMQKRFPGGIDVSTHTNWQDRFNATEALIESANTPIYEATLRATYKGTPLLCMIDMLVPTPQGWQIYEIKSATKVKAEYLPDVAFQYFVATLLGLEIESAHVIHLNNGYVRHGEINIQQLGTCTDVTDKVCALQGEVASQLAELRLVNELPFEPRQPIGLHCQQPYDCAFMHYCWKEVPKERSVFAYLPLGKAHELFASGYTTIDEVPEDYPLPASHALRMQHIREEKMYLDVEALDSWCAALQYPLYYMDFETVMPAIPLFDASRPYQQIPFQFSVHIQHTPGGPLTHHAFLAEADGTDPRPLFIQQLLQCLGKAGSILVYNQAFEQSRLNELARDFPQYAAAIAGLLPRMIDLLVPFRRLMVYHPAMKGSASIKAVLPALVPDMSYDDLDIGNGGDAMTVFANMLGGAYTPQETAKLREDLLAYCARDTEGMVALMGWINKAKQTP